MAGRPPIVAQVRRTLAARAAKVRRLRDELDNKEVREARKLVRALRSGPPDLVLFGDSTWVFYAKYDTDQRNLAQMVLADLRPSVRTHVTMGAGYHAKPLTAFLHQIERSGARPVVVLPLVVRLHSVAWSTHPAYSYVDASARIESFPATTPTRRIRASIPPPGPADFETYGRQQIDTFAGTLPISALRDPLRDPDAHGLSRTDQERLLYAFHHGEPLEPGQSTMVEVEEMGRALRSLDVPVVAFHTPVPVEHGVELWGEAFRERLERNFEVLDEAFLRGFGSALPIQRTGLAFASSEFIDPADGTEHLNQIGRLRMCSMLLPAIEAALDRRPD